MAPKKTLPKAEPASKKRAREEDDLSEEEDDDYEPIEIVDDEAIPVDGQGRNRALDVWPGAPVVVEGPADPITGAPQLVAGVFRHGRPGREVQGVADHADAGSEAP